jgi:hypothetical protein
VPFPVSFICERIRDEESCGSEIAAGIAGGLWGNYVAFHLPRFVLLKDNVKSELVRLNLGAPLSEVEPWHVWCCRFGSMEGSEGIQWLVARTMDGILISYLFIDIPECFTVDQRRHLFGLFHRADYITSASKAKSRESSELLDELWADCESIYHRYGLPSGEQENLPAALSQLEPGSDAQKELLAAFYRHCYRSLALEYGESFDRVKTRFDQLMQFDFATFSWPEEN